MEAGQSPETFWDQTILSHAAVMAGVARRIKREIERDTVLAWRIGNFVGAAQGGKLKNLSHYLDQLKPQHATAPAIEAAAVFQSLADRGLAKIRIVPHRGGEERS